MELYCSARPDDCLGCGRPITAGDVAVPAERGWLLCLDCGAGLLIGQSLPAWPAAEPASQAPGSDEAIGAEDGAEESEGAEGERATGGLKRWEAMQAHGRNSSNGSRTGQTWAVRGA